MTVGPRLAEALRRNNVFCFWILMFFVLLDIARGVTHLGTPLVSEPRSSFEMIAGTIAVLMWLAVLWWNSGFKYRTVLLLCLAIDQVQFTIRQFPTATHPEDGELFTLSRVLFNIGWVVALIILYETRRTKASSGSDTSSPTTTSNDKQSAPSSKNPV